MSFDPKRIYELLPALYRIRDTEAGLRNLSPGEKAIIENLPGSLDQHIHGPLKSLLTIIADQIAILEENLDQLYDDQFIETCSEWAVAYIGELVGSRELIPIKGIGLSKRGEVANTIAYRRRKGTASIIEQLAHDVTGWESNVVEYFQLLATTQYLNHLRPQNKSFVSLRDWEALEYANTPFDEIAHTADVRRIEQKRGLYNIQNIGIFLWRLRSYASTQSPAYKLDDRRFTFDPIGKNGPLYNAPETEKTITHLAKPINVAMPISRRVLYEHLETYYGREKSILIFDSNFLNDGAILPENASPAGSALDVSDLIKVCNLSDLLDGTGNVIGWANMPNDKIAIDPLLGRIAFPAASTPPGKVHVNYYYGFSADLGGGEYSRSENFSKVSNALIKNVPSETHPTIQSALDDLQITGGVVEITDNEYYFETPVIRVADGKTIEIRSVENNRPVLVLEDYMHIEAEGNSKVIINGLLISGGGIFIENDQTLQLLRLEHCTLIPCTSPGFEIPGSLSLIVPEMVIQPRIVVESLSTIIEIEKSITGALRVVDGATVKIKDSIIDAGDETAIAFSGILENEAGGTLHINESTIIGKIKTILMEMASNSIFMADGAVSAEWLAPVMAMRLQSGCVRFSYIPPGSRLPRPYRCQPSKPDDIARVRPTFTSLVFGDAGYGQLNKHCAVEITEGADDKSEMGVYHHLYQAQRVINLRTRLDEYLRFGMEAGIFFAS